MAINYLIDTNIFLEILLNQEKKELCKKYLNSKFEHLAISDFSLHSIGVILFRINKNEIFNSFLNDILPRVEVLSVQKGQYSQISSIASQFNLDFDDAYQTTVARSYNLIITTMDKDFEKIRNFNKVDFIK